MVSCCFEILFCPKYFAEYLPTMQNVVRVLLVLANKILVVRRWTGCVKSCEVFKKNILYQ